MVEKPTNRSMYWCISPSTESANYGDTQPRKPWRGVFIDLKLCQGTTENWDEDSNASCYPRNDDLFITEAEAVDGYLTRMAAYLREKEDELDEAKSDFRAFAIRHNRTDVIS